MVKQMLSLGGLRLLLIQMDEPLQSPADKHIGKQAQYNPIIQILAHVRHTQLDKPSKHVVSHTMVNGVSHGAVRGNLNLKTANAKTKTLLRGCERWIHGEADLHGFNSLPLKCPARAYKI